MKKIIFWIKLHLFQTVTLIFLLITMTAAGLLAYNFLISSTQMNPTLAVAASIGIALLIALIYAMVTAKKRFWIFLRLYWLRILAIILIISAIIFSSFFVNYCMENFFLLERSSRRQISGQMALLLPMFLLVQLIATPIMIALQFYFMQGGFARLTQNKIGLAQANVKWDDVIGMEEAKKDAWELVELLKDRGKLKRTGGKIIKGMLMLGPPGCGKTYLAKAIATECGLPMISASGSEFIGMFVGIGTAHMKALFKRARALADLHGGCLIFIDEIDSFARPRQADQGFGGTMDRNATINQFLTEVDGLRKTENNIVILGATNCHDYELDSAITRPGRLERKINVTRPNLKEREAIFQLYLKRVEYNPETINIKLMARKTVWFTPAEIESMVREAALLSQRNQHERIEKDDINEAYERVAFGQKSNVVQNERDKLWTAYHEAGHALMYYLLATEEDVIKATIIPRRGALGYVFARPKDEKHMRIKEEYLTSIKVSLGSYVVEQRKFGTSGSGVGGGPGSDFAHAIDAAHTMVWSLGMGPSGIIGDYSSSLWSWGYWSSSSPISEHMKTQLDKDVQTILQQCLKATQELVERHWEAVEYFAHQLYLKEELDFDEIEDILGKKFNLPHPQSIQKDVPENLLVEKQEYQALMAKERKTAPSGPRPNAEKIEQSKQNT